MNKKFCVPDVLTLKDGTFQSFDVKTRGYNKSNFPIEHPADKKIKNYKLDNGKYGKDKNKTKQNKRQKENQRDLDLALHF